MATGGDGYPNFASRADDAGHHGPGPRPTTSRRTRRSARSCKAPRTAGSTAPTRTAPDPNASGADPRAGPAASITASARQRLVARVAVTAIAVLACAGRGPRTHSDDRDRTRGRGVSQRPGLLRAGRGRERPRGGPLSLDRRLEPEGRVHVRIGLERAGRRAECDRRGDRPGGRISTGRSSSSSGRSSARGATIYPTTASPSSSETRRRRVRRLR